MPYTADKPNRARSSEQLRSEIPGWGADLDPTDRPAVPREKFAPESTGAHWTFPERQETSIYRERSIEHAMLTPVFGTAAPLKGVSGAIRRYAYARHSEGKAAHWLLLIAADRVDAIESHVASFATRQPDNPITQTGISSELTSGPVRSRVGRKRADLSHTWIDPFIVAGPWVVVGGLLAVSLRALVRRTDR